MVFVAGDERGGAALQRDKPSDVAPDRVLGRRGDKETRRETKARVCGVELISFKRAQGRRPEFS